MLDVRIPSGSGALPAHVVLVAVVLVGSSSATTSTVRQCHVKNYDGDIRTK